MSSNQTDKAIESIHSLSFSLEEACTILKGIGINSIGYSRFYTDKCIRLSNNIEWITYYLQNDILLRDRARYLKEIHPTLEKGINLVIREQDQGSNIIKNNMLTFSQHNVCSMYIKNNDNYIEMFGFASFEYNEDLSNFYINNIDILLKYTLLFKEKTFHLINNKIDDLLLPFNAPIQPYIDMEPSKRSILNSQIKLKKIYLTDNITVSPKEYECISYLAQGCTYKNIAIAMNISPRTVETHLKNVKNKLSGNYKTDILKVIKNHSNLFYSGNSNIFT